MMVPSLIHKIACFKLHYYIELWYIKQYAGCIVFTIFPMRGRGEKRHKNRGALAFGQSSPVFWCKCGSVDLL